MSQADAFQLIICPDADVLAEQAADRIIEAGRQAIAARGRYTLVLTGGSTPEKTYTLLPQPDRSAHIDWSRTFLFFGDERFVPHDDPRSNFALAQRTLLSRAPIRTDHVFPIPTNLSDAADCASAYTRLLAGFFGLEPGKDVPRFDLVLLGMGDDGHTASLFPGMPTTRERRAWVVASPPGTLPPPVERITLTFPVLNAAHEVLFLVAGEKKAAPLRSVLEEPANPTERPASGVRPANGTLAWLVDAAAARLLRRP